MMYAEGSDDFMVDSFGSVPGVTDVASGVVENTYRYKPYGATLSGSPSGTGFFWTGNTGSRRTGRNFAEQYNWARHYSSKTSQWITRDPLWPRLAPFVYASADPMTNTDSTGYFPVTVRATCWNVVGKSISNQWCGKPESYTYAFDNDMKKPGPTFCNPSYALTTKACNRYTAKMSAAFPNMIRKNCGKIKVCCSGTKKVAKSDCSVYPDMSTNYQPHLGGPLECGSKVTVAKNGHFITLTFVDAGPHGQNANAGIDLSPDAAKSFAAALGIKWNGCNYFAIESVVVNPVGVVEK